jgi:group II intron reverse transcriptase/maturase
MHGTRKSDSCIVPEKPPNKGGGAPSPAEGVEERRLTKGNSGQQTRHRTLSRASLQQELDRIRQAARRDKKQRFTALWHHVYRPERLAEAYWRMNRKGAAGVDKVTWEAYGENLEENLKELSGRLRRGAYRARPVRRVYIPKSDGRQRPLGVPALEDKIVQSATTEVLNAVYEQDFLGFSYGFRPGRSQHDALDAVTVGLKKRKVNWVLDADIRGYFDAISHEWMIRFLEHRIGDQRVIRHVKKWLKAGVLLEDGKMSWGDHGTPQGGSVSPLLANIYLHYAYDLWIQAWRKRATGDVVVVRYADDFIVGFQHRAEAERFLRELHERLAKFSLELHPTKTRLIEFGRFAAENRQKRGGGKPETFDFLGFTHACGRTRRGYFQVIRLTVKKRLRAKLKEIKVELRRMLHDPIPVIGEWLGKVLNGYYRYFAVPGNAHALWALRFQVGRLWYRTLKRRSQRHRLKWERMIRLIDRWLPKPRILHPYPEQRLRVTTRGRSPVR